VLEVPFLFQDVSESDYVREELMPSIEQGFHDNGYELLGWMEVGFIHFFSKKPIQSMDDLKKMRIWLWQGDPLGEAFFSASKLAPIPLSIIDVYSQLSTRHGAIDTVYMSPFGALAMQWHTKVKYVTNIPMTNGIGGLIVSRKFFDKLPADLQEILKRTGAEAGEKIIEIARRDNQQSIELLKQSGLEFTWNWEDVDHKEVFDIRDRAAKFLGDSNYIPYNYFERTRKLLDQYRKQHAQDKAGENRNTDKTVASAVVDVTVRP
jgi:TRAP-type C4-dicarboxylate transport system substrate-binding protein